MAIVLVGILLIISVIIVLVLNKSCADLDIFGQKFRPCSDFISIPDKNKPIDNSALFT
jgi:hypothetical protein